MKPTQGRIVTYYRSVSSDSHLESFAALIIAAELRPPRVDLEGKLVPWDPRDEGSYAVRVHVFGRTVEADGKYEAEYSKTAAAGCWAWPAREPDDVPMVREVGPGPTPEELAERDAGKQVQAQESGA